MDLQPVTIVARSTDEAAFEGFSQSALFIDGFTLRGGTDAGFLFGDSSGITIQDCTVTGSGGDAVHFERSDDVLVFNNLLTGNKGAGVIGARHHQPADHQQHDLQQCHRRYPAVAR